MFDIFKLFLKCVKRVKKDEYYDVFFKSSNIVQLFYGFDKNNSEEQYNLIIGVNVLMANCN